MWQIKASDSGVDAMLVCVGSDPCGVRIGVVTKRPAEIIELAVQQIGRHLDEEGIDWLYDIPIHNV